MKNRTVILSANDNVATALADLKSGETLKVEIGGRKQSIRLTTDVPFGHKISLSKIASGAPVIKYGDVIGLSTKAIDPGDHVHIHNVVSARGRGDLEGGAA